MGRHAETLGYTDDKMTNTEIQSDLDRLGKLSPWYHCIKLPGGLVTPGWTAIAPIWDSIRKVRESIVYKDASVLDLGSRDGMWAFEAEQLGASTVVATDIGDDGYREHILWLKQILKSKVAPFYNVPAQDAWKRLDCFVEQNGFGRFDIVQHLGLFYHLPDPLISLKQCYTSLERGGKLLFETACFTGGTMPLALLNTRSDVYADKETFWAFNKIALLDSMRMCGFEVLSEISEVPQTDLISRVAFVAGKV